MVTCAMGDELNTRDPESIYLQRPPGRYHRYPVYLKFGEEEFILDNWGEGVYLGGECGDCGECRIYQ